MVIVDKVGGEDSGGQARWRICGKTGMDMAAEDIQDSNRRDVGRQRWLNGLEERRRNGQILTGNDYLLEGLFYLR